MDAMVQLAIERQFFNAVAMFLLCRQAGMNDNHVDKFGALLGELDWRGEARLIVEEIKNGFNKTDRSKETRGKTKG